MNKQDAIAPRTPQAGAATPEELIARAAGLRELIRSQQDEAETLGRYNQEVHEALVKAGLYDVLTPRVYGGYEYDVATFVKIVVELGRADPGSSWCYALGHGHALTTAASWTKEAQDDVFNHGYGYFRASHSLAPGGTAKKVDGGYLVNGKSAYQSGVPYSSHATLNLILEGSEGKGPGGMPTFLQTLVPAEDFTICDNWGGDHVLGMRASGSNSVEVKDVVVPECYAVELPWLTETERTTSIGAEQHDNSLYLGVGQTFLQCELVACIVGAAYAALDEYEELARTRNAPLPPRGPRIEDAGFQRDFGQCKMKADGAKAMLVWAVEEYGRRCENAFRNGVPFTRKMDIELYGILVQAGELATQAVEQLYISAGTSATVTKGAKMGRYLRDVQTYRTHPSSQYGQLGQRIGAVNFDVATSIF